MNDVKRYFENERKRCGVLKGLQLRLKFVYVKIEIGEFILALNNAMKYRLTFPKKRNLLYVVLVPASYNFSGISVLSLSLIFQRLLWAIPILYHCKLVDEHVN